MSVFRTVLIVMLLALVLAGAAASGALAQDPGGTINVTGQITYISNDGSIRPAAGIQVLVRDWDDDPRPGPTEILADVVTDEDGYFFAANIDNQDYDGSPRRWNRTGQDVLIEVRTQSPEVRLLNTSTLQPFAWSSYPNSFFMNVPDGRTVTLNLQVQASDNNVPGRGMRVYETMRAGWDFIPEDKRPQLDEPIVAQWGATSLDGPYYLPGDRIYYDSSADVFPHTILHQFAHALAWEIQGDAGYPIGCFPAPDDHTFDLKTESTAQCAWTEGWAIGFAMIVLEEPKYRTADTGGAIDMEAPDADTPGWDDGDTVAGRVAGSLWDLFDDVDDGYDTHTPAGSTPQARFEPMWDAYFDGQPTTTRAFWDAYLAGGNDACSAVRAFFQNTIDYNNAPTVQALPDITIPEDSSADDAVDLWAYSSDVECPNDQLTYTFVEEIPPEFGITIDSNRYIDVNPAPDWFGSIEVGIEVSDGLERTRRFFTLTIGAVNDAPTLGDIPTFEALVNTPIVVDLEPYVTDIDNLKSDLSAEVTLLDHSTVTVDGLVLTFTPEQNFEGEETPHLVVRDGAGGVAERDILLIWTRFPNHRPRIVDLPKVFYQDAGQALPIDFESYGEDEEDAPSELVWVVEEVGEHASVLRQNSTTLQFSPEPAGYLGSETVTVVVTDRGGGQSDPAEFEIVWTPPTNQAPQVLKTLGERKAFIGRPLTLNLEGYASDPDGHDAALVWFPNKTSVDCCQVSLAEKQKIIFFPLPGWGTQSDEVELIVQDPQGAQSRTTVLLTWELFKLYLPFITNNVSGP